MKKLVISILLICYLLTLPGACVPATTPNEPSPTTPVIQPYPTPLPPPSTTDTPPPLPYEISTIYWLPWDGTTDVPLKPGFLWHAVDSAAAYEFILSDSNDSINPVISKTGPNALNETYYVCEKELEYGTTYFWKIRAISQNNSSEWVVNVFTTTSGTTLQPIIEAARESTELIDRHYSWQYKGTYTWDLKLPQVLYEYFKEIPRPPTENYSVYVTHPYDDEFIDALVNRLNEAADKSGFNELEKVELAIAFVQGLPYTSDSITTPHDEYPRYPIETLVDNGGDCEDTSILLASLLYSMGYGSILIVLPNHIGVGIKGSEGIYGSYYEYKGDRYYYIETTGEGWSIGQLPEEYENTSAKLYPMLPTPILDHDWDATITGNTLELEVTVRNLGTATAYDVFVLAGFDAGEDKIWNPEESESFNVEVNQQVTLMFNLRVPLGKHTRLLIQISDDGYAVDESHSEWFDT
jgi:hypothetical protein